VVFIKKYNFQNVHNEIFGYVYENYLKELYEEEKKGQYFTDPSVVNFMLEQVGYTAKEIRNKIKAGEQDKLSIVDPACGSGTFLYRATDEVVKSFGTITDETSKEIENIVTSNVYGLDVEEFPLYLAEMGILMRMLPLIMGEKYNNPLDKKIKVFWTNDSIAEFIGSELITLGKQISFPEEIIRPKLESFVRTEEDLTEMKESMALFPWRRFDYVVANPPYISYIECVKQGLSIFQLMKGKDKRTKVSLSNIFGVNLHSTPLSQKKRTPKPNLYSFFVALGLALLKDDGRLCYIIPQTILTAGDLDVLRYHLAKYVTIEKIFTFNSNLFIERGVKQKRIVPTSSLILVISKNAPSKTHEVEVINYKGVEDTIKDTLNNIVKGEKTDTRKVKQADLLENTINWNFIKQDKAFRDFYEKYRRNTEDISIYYQHALAEKKFGNKFYFDTGFKIDEKNLLETPSADFYTYFKPNKRWWKLHDIRGYWPNDRNPKSEFYIGLLQPFKGYTLLDTKFKILWSYANPDRFYFTDEPTIWARNHFCAIGSDNTPELFYISSMLNSPINQVLLSSLLKNENEKNLLIPVRAVRDFVRVPLITPKNRHIKKEIIERTRQMLALEEKTLSDFVDFSGVLVQRFDDVQVDGKALVLHHGNRKTQLPIKRDTKLVATAIAKKPETEGMKLEKHEASLAELRNLQVIDFEKQAQLKDYIDDLVFALYFKIPLKEVGLDKSEEIQKACTRSRYYQLL